MGRLLGGINPTESEFLVILPNFTSGMEHVDINEFVMLLFGKIIDQYDELYNVKGTFLIFASSLKYHSGRFKEFVLDNYDHFLHKFTIWYDLQLLHRVKKLVTVDRTPDITNPSVIYLQVKVMEIIKVLKKEFMTIKDSLTNLSVQVKEYIFDAIRENDLRIHTITKTVLEVEFNKLSDNLSKNIDKNFTALGEIHILGPTINLNAELTQDYHPKFLNNMT